VAGQLVSTDSSGGKSLKHGSSVAPSVVAKAIQSPGRPPDAATRERMENRLGFDLSLVRIHDDATAAEAAREIDAAAYAFGHHVVFASGQYAPGSAAGDRLLAHELTHVVQQGGIGTAIQRAPRAAASSDELPTEIRNLLDHTQERFNYYVTSLRPYYRNSGDLGRKAAEYLQRDFAAVFGEGVVEVPYSLVESQHRIDLYISEYNLGIELKLSGAVRVEQKRAFFYRAWGGAKRDTLAYVNSEGWWAGAGDKLKASQIKSLRAQASRLKNFETAEIEEAARKARVGRKAGKGASAEAEETSRIEGQEARAEGKLAAKAGKRKLGAKLIGTAGGVLGLIDIHKDLKSDHWLDAAGDVISLAEPELGLAAALAHWGYRKLFGESKEDEAPKKPAEPPPAHLPVPGAHYFITFEDGRAIEVDAFSLLNQDTARPIYAEEAFPGEANAQWRQAHKFKLAFGTPE
jgi:hypothetical protein